MQPKQSPLSKGKSARSEPETSRSLPGETVRGEMAKGGWEAFSDGGDRDHHHDHGAGMKVPHGGPSARFGAAADGVPQLCPELPISIRHTGNNEARTQCCQAIAAGHAVQVLATGNCCMAMPLFRLATDEMEAQDIAEEHRQQRHQILQTVRPCGTFISSTMIVMMIAITRR